MKEVNEIHNKHNLKRTMLGEEQFGKPLLNHMMLHFVWQLNIGLPYLESWHYRMFKCHIIHVV